MTSYKRYSVLKKYVNGESGNDNLLFVTVDQYALIGKNEDKYLLFSFANNAEERLNALTFRIEEYTAKGDFIKAETVALDKLDVAPSAIFGRDKKIKLAEACADVRLTVVSGRYGKYIRSNENGTTVLSFVEEEKPRYSAEKISELADGKRHSRTTVYKANPLRIAVASLVTVILASVAFFMYLNYFTSTETTFVRDGCEYAFVVNDGKKEVVLTRYRGLGGKAVVPDMIESYKVRRINGNAFSNVANLYTLEIQGDPEIQSSAFENFISLRNINLGKITSIPDSAFRNCSLLETVESDCVTEIGSFAFENCASLKSVTLGGEKVVSIEYGAFRNCKELTDFSSTSDIDLKGNGISVFAGCYNVKNLTLASLTQEYNFSSASAKNNFFAGLFYGLTTLKIGFMKDIPADFCKNYENLERVEISELANATVGDNAFLNCRSLTELALPVSITEVGRSAFENTALETFSSAKLKKIGARAFAGMRNLKRFVVSDNIESLPESIFESCTSLASVKLSITCNDIGKNAFNGCSSLEDVTLPLSVEKIQAGAFAGCSSLKKMVIPASVAVIGELAFKNCSSLKDFVIPATVTEIGYGILTGCRSLGSLTVPYVGSGPNVQDSSGFQYFFKPQKNFYGGAAYIPASLKKVTVTQCPIYDRIFEDAENVREIYFGEDCPCEYVGERAFAGCKSLVKVSWPSTVTKIGSGAFANCSSLTAMTVAGNVQEIGTGVFAECDSLKELTLPFIGPDVRQSRRLNYLFDEKFGVPSSLKKLTVRGGNIVDYAFYYCNNLETVEFGGNANEVGAYAFYGCESLQTVSVPSSVERIGDGAFGSCLSLSAFAFPKSLKTIGSQAFFNCIRLKVVSLPQSTEEIGSYAFLDCFSLKSVTFPEKLYSLSDDAFTNCYHLYTIYNLGGIYVERGYGVAANALAIYDYVVSPVVINGFEFTLETGASDPSYYLTDYSGTETELVLPSGVKVYAYGINAYKIPEKLFYYKDDRIKFTKINVGNAVTEIGREAFSECRYLEKVILGKGLEVILDRAFAGNGKMSEAIFSEQSSLKSVGEEAFVGCGLTEINLPDGLETICYRAFSDCSSLSEAILPGSLINIDAYAFSNCGIKTLELKEGVNNVTTIGTNAFCYCYALESVVIPDSVRAVGSGAFEGCYSLRELTIKGGVREIYANAFVGLNLRKVEIEKGVGVIGESAFAYCNYLEEVNVGGGTQIGSSAFSGCGALRSLVIGDGEADVGAYAFANCSSLETAYIGKNVGVIGYGAFNACRSLKTLTLSEGLNEIGNEAFSYCTALTSVAVPAGVNRIGDSAFYSCIQLDVLNLPEGVEYIGSSAFAYCSALTSVTIPSGIKYITQGMFNSCSSLKDVTISSGVTTIAGNAFEYCDSLELLKLPSTLVSIGDYAFNACTSLYEIYNPSSLYLQKGSYDNGGVAAYAYQINTDMSKPLMKKVWTDAMYFIRPDDGWVIVKQNCGNYSERLTLAAFSAEGETINSYRIGNNLFANGNIKQLDIGKEVTEIGVNAFAYNYRLETVIFDSASSLTELPDGIFNQCVSLSKVVFGDKLERIGSNAFYGCDLSETEELPSSLKTIDSGAFMSTGIKCVYLPERLSSIAYDAFSGCGRLLEVYNLSKYLPSVVAGETNNGYVAFNAVIVNTDKSAPRIVYADYVGADYLMTFLKISGEWNLYYVSANGGVLTLPESATVNGITINEYKIMDHAIINDISAFDGVVIPASVKKINTETLNYHSRFIYVYYKGTQNEWNKLISGQPSLSNVYYYNNDKCLHYLTDEEKDKLKNQWTYEGNAVSIQTYEFELKATVAPTCTEKGKEIYECSHCGATRTVEFGTPNGHKYNDKGICTECGYKKPVQQPADSSGQKNARRKESAALPKQSADAVICKKNYDKDGGGLKNE